MGRPRRRLKRQRRALRPTPPLTPPGIQLEKGAQPVDTSDDINRSRTREYAFKPSTATHDAWSGHPVRNKSHTRCPAPANIPVREDFVISAPQTVTANNAGSPWMSLSDIADVEQMQRAQQEHLRSREAGCQARIDDIQRQSKEHRLSMQVQVNTAALKQAEAEQAKAGIESEYKAKFEALAP